MSIISKETYPFRPIYSNGKFSSDDFSACMYGFTTGYEEIMKLREKR